MELILFTGGARSGKSRLAEAAALRAGGADVTYVATAVAGDEEMETRIRRHRADRPAGWTTVEAQSAVGGAIRAARTDVVMLDCLTLLASNALLAAADDGEEAAHAAVRAETDALLAAAASRDGLLLVVTNEVGFGVVPAHALGRWYRDALGVANQRIAAAARDVVLVVSGIPMAVKGSVPLT
ncbi:bifunctional adenosylcobinamide kinase/adenosylcobinamide-phosphate guanylyltransferase [Longimicrobium sp.]|uniref:bifunctional adenosylcobinamide kinase/adenosylcobinamide-phosphate guanylyltransferase n=1 Tax=Longimicrobium sp. TaxID=2029185 RepID=UPI002E312E04|nr:bifunctional adenosylcobinamide kinase/adenosylcobinamide-phosphate guanylyltransferase [Longimicrobium sp.]HEX6037562.1 bifunctional adenosylcobinamide kinase/adenosylcobinamide-phosphate guanylyltransferase [Longimicrobium sp.]